MHPIPRISKAPAKKTSSRFGCGQPPAAYNYHELTIQMSVAPEEHVRLLSDVPGLVPERLSYDPSTYDWTLVARIYHPQQEGG